MIKVWVYSTGILTINMVSFSSTSYVPPFRNTDQESLSSLNSTVVGSTSKMLMS